MKSFNKLSKFEQNEMICSSGFMALLKKENIDVEVTYATNKYSPYDVYFKAVSENKHYFVELKQRGADYDSFILEHKKLEGMRRQALIDYDVDLDDCVFLYVNFTPSKTVVWNITNVDAEMKAEKGIFNKATSRNRNDKKTKSVYYLPTSAAKKVYDYVLDKRKIIQSIKDREK